MSSFLHREKNIWHTDSKAVDFSIKKYVTDIGEYSSKRTLFLKKVCPI